VSSVIDAGSGAIGIAGSGAVAQALGRLLCDVGLPVVAVASRSSANARRAAEFMGSGVQPVAVQELPRCAHRVIVATADEGITATARVLSAAGFVKGMALHTCGSRGPEALAPLREAGVECGVLHPLQTIPTPEQGSESLRGIAFALAGDAGATRWGAEIIAALGGRELRINPEDMAVYHAGAVLASNVLVAVVDAALRTMARAGVARGEALAAIAPLCRTSLENALRLGPEAALTGPVARGDSETVRAHVSALSSGASDVADLYRSGGSCLLDMAARRGLPDAAIRAVAAALRTQSGD
jgi:predicted short-subunit dehydrogenase-like oxidoreductase (DUF2520 family)